MKSYEVPCGVLHPADSRVPCTLPANHEGSHSNGILNSLHRMGGMDALVARVPELNLPPTLDWQDVDHSDGAANVASEEAHV